MYVALTRARDKLFITGFVKDFKGLCQKQAGPALVSKSETLPTSLITEADSYLDWFIMSLSRHLEGNPIRVYSEVEDVGLMDLLDKTCRLSITLHDGARYNSTPKHVAKEPALLAAVERLEPIQAEPLADEIIGRFNFAYPYMGAVQRAAKISVSELKRRFSEPEEEATHMVEANVRYKQVSKFSESSKEITDLGLFEVKPQALMDQEEVASGARWGTLMHEAMQWLPMKAYTQQSLREALDRLTLDGYFTVDERRVLNERALYRFLPRRWVNAY